MDIAVFGTGYLGVTHAACMAELGHEVIGVDVDPAKIAQLQKGEAPLYEPGLADLLRKHTASGRLRFTCSYELAARADVHFIAVGTPQRADSAAADLTQVNAVIETLGPLLTRPAVVLGKSTVPVGTAVQVAARLRELAPSADIGFGWNPEFLREGTAVEDTLRPDRIVLGAAAADRSRVKSVAREVYAQSLADGTPLVTTDLATAELTKVAANSFLATKISFINSVAEVCDAVDADVTVLADAIGYDNRIGRRFLNAGLGFGGACLPKDVRAFRARAEELGATAAADLLSGVDEINARQRTRVATMALDACSGIDSPRAAVLGLTFKPDSDDVRDSPALDVAARLADAGVEVQAWDPHGMDNAEKRHPELRYCDSPLAACKGADVVLVMTEWAEIRDLTPEQLSEPVQQRVLIDARNCLDPDVWRDAGWTYRGIGRR
ncbi:nucleotide sugar dehydrogenase [Gordonia sp. HNM0687]|uniref:UDP-glucose 6-dehydrogenase n=2 Tax=Gordonia mangrovi TaxID=2665643 RepID=A0A6L7GN48_9ACTN|nr:nucleotide sugar dehydrogenase [Gordonia mangrovi]